MMEDKSQQESASKLFFGLLGVVAIISILVPVSLAFSYRNVDSTGAVRTTGATAVADSSDDTNLLENLDPLSESDHVRGNRDAVVQVINYSDYLCPFCQKFHTTSLEVFGDYDPDRVVWVSRHLPIIGGENSMDLARASECVAEQGGDGAFARYTDMVYERVTGNTLSGRELAVGIAQEMSLDIDSLNTCLDSGKYDEKINSQIEGAFAIGANGTPFSVVVAADGTKYPINGAQSAATVRQLIETALTKN